MKGLVELYDKYENAGLEIFMFPCNQFGKELEPHKEVDIKAYSQDRWGAQFPMFHKVKVNGSETCEVFKFLRSKTPQFVDRHETPQLHEGGAVGLKIKDVPNNFCKWLVDKQGQVVDCLPGEYDDPRKLEERLRKFLGLSHMK